MWRVEPCVSLAIKNTEIKNQVSQIFKNKGYQPNVGNKNIWLRKKNDILRFYKEIKFIEGSKIKKSKGFRGLEKNKLLAYIVKHLEIDKTLKELKKQKSKEKIVNHIREKSLNM